METKNNTSTSSVQRMEDKFPKGFLNQFKSKETFQEYVNSLLKQGIEEMLAVELYKFDVRCSPIYVRSC